MGLIKKIADGVKEEAVNVIEAAAIMGVIGLAEATFEAGKAATSVVSKAFEKTIDNRNTAILKKHYNDC